MQSWIFLTILLSQSSAQYLGTNITGSGICQDEYCNSPEALLRLKNCVVIVGNLRVVLFEFVNNRTYVGKSLPNLREVTGFVVFYRLRAMETLGYLFPNLARIRGRDLLNDYSLVINEMFDLKEIGLYNLMKIDRGGVSIWGGPRTCYVDSVDWEAIAPNSKHTLTSPEMNAHCDFLETCDCGNYTSNYCWNSENCQRFLKDDECHPECLGCIKGDRNKCLVCRNYTFRGTCVSQCPNDTIILPANQYCLTLEECKSLYRFSWNNTCVMDCPLGYHKVKTEDGALTCRASTIIRSTTKICPSMTLYSLNSIQYASGCTYINGSLTIHVRSIPGVIEELKIHLKSVLEIRDYLKIYDSEALSSLEFLPNLRRIRGQKLKNGAHSFIVYDMEMLKDLFSPKVMENLTIDRGKIRFYRNPKLCLSKIYEISGKFPTLANESDIPFGMNGYNGGCLESELAFSIKTVSESVAIAYFTRLPRDNVTYTLFYTKVFGNKTFIPECCSDAKWFAIEADVSTRKTRAKIVVTDLLPASTFVACLEVHVHSDNVLQALLTRTDLKYFTTTFMEPEPPFITDLTALSSSEVSLKWLDHKDYRHHIVYHKLAVKLVEIPLKDLKARNHCEDIVHPLYVDDEYYSPHSVISEPTANYIDCGSNCDTIFRSESAFDVCDILEEGCNRYEEPFVNNSTLGKFVRTMTINITASRTELKVEGLAPYRDYRFRLRSCVEGRCSRSTRSVVRTLTTDKADMPILKHYGVNESGHISVKWEPPDVTNGPILRYSVLILPLIKIEGDNSSYLPHSICVLYDKLELTVRSSVAEEFNVSVCSTSLGSQLTCSDWKTISKVPYRELEVVYSYYSIIFSILIISFSLIVGYVYHRRKKVDDDGIVPLVDLTSAYRSESEPPCVMHTDFMPFYPVSLTESLEY